MATRIYNVKDAPFNAIGDGVSHPLTAVQAASYMSTFGSIGLSVVAGDQNDYAATQAALLQASIDGSSVYSPSGNYYTNKPLGPKWTATPDPGQPAIPLIESWFGDGQASTIITATGITTPGVAVCQFLGESNVYAVSASISHILFTALHDCDLSLAGMRIGDANDGFSCYRVTTACNNGLILKVASSATYAQINTHFVECTFYANYGLFTAETASLSWALQAESGGAAWDNIHFQSCMFGGLAETRASIVCFDNCQFFGSSKRATSDGHWHNSSLVGTLGNLVVRNCYFEDHFYGILVANTIGNIDSVLIEGCHFSGTNNDTTAPPPQTAIYAEQLANGLTFSKISIIGNSVLSAGYAGPAFIAENLNVFDRGNVDLGGRGVAITRDYTGATVDYQDENGVIQTTTLHMLDTGPTAILTEGGVKIKASLEVDQVITSTGDTVLNGGGGSAATNAWGYSVANAAASDTLSLQWSSTAYQPGGVLPWVTNDQPYLYVPWSKTFSIGVGLDSLPTISVKSGVVTIPSVALMGTAGKSVRAVTATYTLSGTDEVIVVDATSANIVITLPSAAVLGAGWSKRFTFMRKDSVSAHTVAVKPVGSEKYLDGTTSKAIAIHATLEIASDAAALWGVV